MRVGPGVVAGYVDAELFGRSAEDAAARIELADDAFQLLEDATAALGSGESEDS
ncbi:hypothetical protein AB0H77_27095 [Streptomyces sp. NPDC050844]|uniref:hypothetical protein n=1 Tax=Streptomyces sp. NPDC050844 TaxID=3155790 RepID=UPI00340303C9